MEYIEELYFFKKIPKKGPESDIKLPQGPKNMIKLFEIIRDSLLTICCVRDVLIF